MNRLKTTDLQTLADLKIKKGEPNFLLGIPGNGFSTQIQREIYQQQPVGVTYHNYLNFPDPSEQKILLEIMNSVLRSGIGQELKLSNFNQNDELLSIFSAGVNLLKDHPSEDNLELVILFDDFHRTFSYSNAFFFVLDKILSIGQIFSWLDLTSVLVSDCYVDPNSLNATGVGKLIFHYFNFEIIPTVSRQNLVSSVINKNFSKLTPKDQSKVYDLSGGNPALTIALSEQFLIDSNLSPTQLLENYELEWKIHEIWSGLGTINQDFLRDFMQINKIPPVKNKLQYDFLDKTGIFNFDSPNIRIKLLVYYMEQLKDLEIQANENIIIFNGENIFLSDFPKQEREVFQLLYQNKNKIVTRDEIAKRIWADNYSVNYSDYAIDKVISRIRSRLNKFKLGQMLKTQKGEGYIFRD